MQLTPPQRKHLLRAYCDDWCCELSPDSPGERRTIRSLLDKGLIRPAPDETDACVVTSAGRAALGVQLPKGRRPKRMFTAVRRALEALSECKGKLMRPREVTPPWVSDEVQADFTDAVAVVELDFPLWHDDHLDWHAAGRMVADMGFPCEVENIRHLVVFYRVEE